MKWWQFDALDSLFFRGAKSFNQGEGGFLDSQFPPTAQTMAGVIRAAIGDAMGVDWKKFRNGNQPEVATLIGQNSDDHGTLNFSGPYIFKNKKRLYPMPLHVLYNQDKNQAQNRWESLQPSAKPLQTDQGDLHLPQANSEGGKPLENAWLDEENLRYVLQGKSPQNFIKQSELFTMESRTGIGRDNGKRKTEQGLLYFTRHIRLEAGVKLVMGVNGADNIQPNTMVRLGGEGRMANVMIEKAQPKQLRETKGQRGVIVLLTHADFSGKAESNLPEDVKLVSACVGKAVREGGWDYKNNKPKPLKSLIPAGSVFFVKGNLAGLSTHLGNCTAFGYGEIAIGIYQERGK